MVEIFCDGGARGNPGPAAYGFVVRDESGVIKEANGYIGVATNNVAEYTAIVEALKWLSNHKKGEDLQFFLDSLLAASQLNGIYKVKNAKIRELLVKIRELENQFSKITYQHVPRDQNKEADKQVNLALDQKSSKFEARSTKY